MHIYGKDQQVFHLTRTRAEKWFSRVNTLIVAAQLACFLAAIIRTAVYAPNSMRNALFASSRLQLQPPYLQSGCVYNVTRSHAVFRDVSFQMRPDNIGYYVSRSVQNLRYLFAVTGTHLAISTINRLWFETNTHELRYHFVVFRKDMVTTWEVLLMVLGIVMTFGVNDENNILQDYLDACNEIVTPVGESQVITVPPPHNYYNSVQPYVELYVSYFLSLAITVLNALVALFNLLHKNPRDEMLKRDQQRLHDMRAAAAAAAQQQQQQQQSVMMPSTMTTPSPVTHNNIGTTQQQQPPQQSYSASVDPAAVAVAMQGSGVASMTAEDNNNNRSRETGVQRIGEAAPPPPSQLPRPPLMLSTSPDATSSSVLTPNVREARDERDSNAYDAVDDYDDDGDDDDDDGVAAARARKHRVRGNNDGNDSARQRRHRAGARRHRSRQSPPHRHYDGSSMTSQRIHTTKNTDDNNGIGGVHNKAAAAGNGTAASLPPHMPVALASGGGGSGSSLRDAAGRSVLLAPPSPSASSRRARGGGGGGDDTEDTVEI